MKNHLKRIPSPRTWLINRKSNKFITRPKPGAHVMDYSLPLGTILRDFVGYTQTMREAKKLLNINTVLIDGKQKKDHRLPVGLFDVISFPELKKDFRVLLDQKGRLMIREIDSAENQIKPCKILGKTMQSKKLQLNLHDGKCILVDKDFKGKVGDTVLIELPDQKIKELFELKENALVYLIRGKRSGDSGFIKELRNDKAVYQGDNEEVETPKKYLFVLGGKKPCIDLGRGQQVEQGDESVSKEKKPKEEKPKDKEENKNQNESRSDIKNE